MLQYAMEEEQIVSPIDFLLRRTGMLLFERKEAQKWQVPILNYMHDAFSWRPSERDQFERDLVKEFEIA